MVNKDRVILLSILLLLVAAGAYFAFFALPWLSGQLSVWGSRKLTETLGTAVSYRAIRISRTGTIIVEDLQIADPFGSGENFFYSPRVEVSIDPLNVVREGILLNRVYILRPAVSIYRRDDGKWNVQGFRKGKKREVKPEAGAKPFRLRIREVVLEDCTARLNGLFGEEIITVLDHTGSLDITSSRQVIVLDETRFSSTYLTLTEMTASGVLTYESNVLSFEGLRLTRDFTDLRLAGGIDFEGHNRVDIRIDRSRFDLDHLPPQYGLRHKVIGKVNVDLTLRGYLDSPEIRGRVYRADGEIFRYRFADLSCSFHLREGTLDVTGLSADFISGQVTGETSFYLRESPRAYRADLVVSGIDITGLPFGIPQEYAGRFNGRILSSGSGFTKESHASTVLLDLERCTFRGVPIDLIQARVLATASGFHVFSSSIGLGGGTVELTGDLGFTAPDADVRFEAAPLERLAAFFPLPQRVGGELHGSMALTDSYTRPSAQGTIRVEHGHLDDWEFAGLEGEIDIRTLAGIPEGEAGFEASGVEGGGIRAESVGAHLLLGGEGIRLEGVEVTFGDSALLAGGADLLYAADGVRLVTEDLRLRYGRLASTVRRLDVTYDSGKRSLEIGELRIALDGGEMDVSGGFSWPDRIGIRAEVDSVPVGILATVFPGVAGIAGECGLALDVGGSAADPTIDVQGRVSRPGYRDALADSLSFRARYAGSRLRLGRLVLAGAGYSGSASGSIPLRLGFQPFRLERVPDEPLELRIEIDRFDIRTAELLSDEIDFMGGYLEGSIAVRGDLDRPYGEGSLAAHDVEGVIARTNTYFRDLEMRSRLDGEELVLSTISASLMGGGSLKGSGRLRTKALRLDEIEMDVEVRDYPVNQTRYISSLVFDSELHLKGPIGDASVTGAVRIRRGILNVPMGGDGGERRGRVPFRLNLNVIAENNLWIRNNQVNAEISVDMDLITEHGRILPVGDLDIIRGSYTYYGSVFDIQEGEIHFFGSDPIDPAIDVLAVRQIWGRVVENGESVRVRNDFNLHVYGRYREVKFDVTVYDAEGDILPIDQQKALTLLLANMTNEEFDQQAAPSRQKFVGQIEGILSQQTTSLIQPISRLDILELRTNLLSNESESRAEVTVGEYLMKDFFVSYSQDIFDPSINNIAVEVYLGKKSSLVGQTDSKGTQYSVEVNYRMKY